MHRDGEVGGVIGQPQKQVRGARFLSTTVSARVTEKLKERALTSFECSKHVDRISFFLRLNAATKRLRPDQRRRVHNLFIVQHFNVTPSLCLDSASATSHTSRTEASGHAESPSVASGAALFHRIAILESLAHVVVAAGLDGNLDLDHACAGLHSQGSGLLTPPLIVGKFFRSVKVLEDVARDV